MTIRAHGSNDHARRRRLLLGTVVGLVLGAVLAAPSLAALPLGYDYKRIDSGNPAAGSSFGWGVASADLTGDGEADLIVAQGTGSQSATAPTFIFIYDGVTGQLVHSITPPEANFDGSDPVIGFVYVETMPDLGSCPGGDSTDADLICNDPTIGDGDGIPEIIIGARELQVDPNATAANQDAERGPGDPKIGRGYVIDGASAGQDSETVVLKRIDMPLADRALQAAIPQSGQQFGRMMISPQGLSPCAGPASEVNNLGIGPCPGNLNDSDPIFPRSVRIGDVTLGGQPDIIVTARSFRESVPTNEAQTVTIRATSGSYTLNFNGSTTAPIAFNASASSVDVALEALPSVQAGSTPGDNVAVTGGPGNASGNSPYTVTFNGFPLTNVTQMTATDIDLAGGTGVPPAAPVAVATTRNGTSLNSAAQGSHCRSATTATTATCATGKVWVYRGEDIAGSNPTAILDVAAYSVQNPWAQLSPAANEFGGNIFRIGDISNPPDDRPDFVVAARNTSYPLTNPDNNLQPAVGVATLHNGENGSLITTYPHPEPQARATFSASFNSGRPAGDLGLTGLPDVVIPAPLQNNEFADDGTAYLFRGDQASGGGGGQGGWQFGQMDDPDPYNGAGFGSSTTGVGDLVGGTSDVAANEMMIGSWGPFDPGTEAAFNSVQNVHIVNPQSGVNLQTISDPTGERGSGFGVGMTPMGDLNGDGFLDFGITAYLSNGPLAGQGRAYILYSDNTSPPTPTPATALASGKCANQKMGTEGDDTLQGTDRGDTLFALGGNDTVAGLADDDCLDGGAGTDALDGGDAADSLLGGAGGDSLLGGAGGDRLFGEGGGDRLVGGGGKDFASGGKGRDKIKIRGGGSDEVNCGKGTDVVVADGSDKISVNCERVRD